MVVPEYSIQNRKIYYHKPITAREWVKGLDIEPIQQKTGKGFLQLYLRLRPQQGNFLFLIQEVIKILCERALQLQNTAV